VTGLGSHRSGWLVGLRLVQAGASTGPRRKRTGGCAREGKAAQKFAPGQRQRGQPIGVARVALVGTVRPEFPRSWPTARAVGGRARGGLVRRRPGR
jgi:hypothetical protein